MRLLVTILMVLLLGGTIFAQELPQLEKLDNGKYTEGFSSKKLHEYSMFFRNNDLQYSNFKKFDRNRKAQKYTNCVALSLPIVGLLVGGIIVNTEETENYVGLIILILSTFGGVSAGVLVAVIGNSIFGTRKGKYKTRLVKGYGYTDAIYEPIQPKLTLQIKGNGLGLCYTF